VQDLLQLLIVLSQNENSEQNKTPFDSLLSSSSSPKHKKTKQEQEDKNFPLLLLLLRPCLLPSLLPSTRLFVGLAYKGKDLVFRFIIEYSSLRDFGP
jgi:hypothetical protein